MRLKPLQNNKWENSLIVIEDLVKKVNTKNK